MARTIIYERGVHSIVADNTLYEKLNSLENGLKIKEEPLDSDGEHSNNETSLPEDDAATYTSSQKAQSDVTSSSSLNNKENEYVLETHPRKKNKKNDGSRKRKKAKQSMPKIECNSKCSEDPEASKNEEREAKGVAQDTHRSFKPRKEEENSDQRNQTSQRYHLPKRNSRPKWRPKSQPEEGIPLQCNVCFLPMKHSSILKRHQQLRSADVMYLCEKCQTLFADKRNFIFHSETCSGIRHPRAVSCDFCEKFFRTKHVLQAHIFHIHSSQIFQSDPVKVSPDTRKKNSVSPKIGGSRTPKGRSSLPKIASNCQTNRQALNFSKNDTTEALNAHDLLSTPMKKMRQTTLTEFLQVSSKKVGSCISPKEEATEAKSMKTRENNKTCLDKSPKPFVQIHTNTTLMMELLNNSGHVKDEPSDDEIQNITSRHNTPYRLRPTRPTVYTPDTFYYLESSMKRKRIYSETEKTGKNEGRLSKKPRRDNRKNDSKIKASFGIKECYIQLVRCDSVGKMFDLVSQEGRKPCTSHAIDAVRNPLIGERTALQNLQEPILNLNGSSIKTDREVKPEYHPEENNPEFHGKPYECKICKKSFSSKKNLSEHKELFHIAYVSSVCNARYTSKYKLLHHYLRQHTIFKRTVCCVCKESFTSRSLLQRHLLIHCVRVLRTKHDRFPIDIITKCNAFQKNHQCGYCSKRFWLSSCMKYHENVCSSRTRDHVQKSSPIENVPSITPSSSEGTPINNKLPTDSISSAMHSVTKPLVKETTIINQSPSTSKKSPSTKLRTPERSVNRASMTGAGPTHEKPWAKKGEKADCGIKDNSDNEAESSICTPENNTRSIGTESAPAVLECSVCNIKFKSITKLTYHTRTYGGELNHRCGLCSLALPNKRLLDQHIHMGHSQQPLGKNRNNCKFCNQSFTSADLQQMHEKHFHASRITVIPEQTWLNEEQVWNINTACNTCNVVFETYDRFVEHNMYYYKGQSFTCTFCGQTFHGLFMLHHHSKLVHYPEATRKSYSYTCDACNEGFNQESHFHAHKLHVHLNESNKPFNALPDTQEQASGSSIQITTTPTIETKQLAFAIYGCNICQMFFTTEADLMAHETEYSVNGDYLCNGCDKRCRTLLILKQHYSLNHIGPDVPNAYKCKQCLEVFTAASSLACHEKHLHPEESSHRYDLIAALEKNVDRAIGTRKPEKLDPASTGKSGSAILKCLICGMAFEKEMDLREHLFEYSNIGEYSCAVCHRKFAETERLEEHKMKHSRINTILAEHHCPICQEGLASAPNVKTHMLHLHGYETFQSVLTKRGCLSTKLLSDHPLSNIDSDSVRHTIPAIQSNVELSVPSEKQTNSVIANTLDILQEDNSNILGEGKSKRHSVEENTPTLVTASTSSAEPPNDCFIVDTTVQTSSDNHISDSVKSFESNAEDVQPKEQNRIIVIDPQSQSIAKLLKNLATPTNSQSLINVQYQCSECYITFNSRRNIAKHIITYANRGDFLCDICPRRFPCESIYQEHYRKHQTSEGIASTEYRYTCQFCNERFQSQRTYRSHLKHLHKKKDPLNSQKDTQLSSSNSTGQSKQRQPKKYNSLYSQTSSQADSSTEFVDRVHISESSNQYKEAETNAMIINVAKPVSTTSQKTSSACLGCYSCQACSMSFDNFSAYHSHCKSVHPNLLLFVDYISSGSNPVSINDTLSNDFKCTICNIPFDDARSFNKHTNDIHIKGSTASNSCIIPIENGSEELRIIWEKKPKPKSSNSPESVGQKNDAVAVNSTDTERKAAMESKHIPRLKVKPFAKIIETLTIENQVEPTANVYFRIPQRAQVVVNDAYTSQPMQNMDISAPNPALSQFQ